MNFLRLTDIEWVCPCIVAHCDRRRYYRQHCKSRNHHLSLTDGDGAAVRARLSTTLYLTWLGVGYYSRIGTAVFRLASSRRRVFTYFRVYAAGTVVSIIIHLLLLFLFCFCFLNFSNRFLLLLFL